MPSIEERKKKENKHEGNVCQQYPWPHSNSFFPADAATSAAVSTISANDTTLYRTQGKNLVK